MPSMKMETHHPPPQGLPTGKLNESTRKVWSFIFFGTRPAWGAAGHKIHGTITEKLCFKVSKLCPFCSYFSSQPYMINCPKWEMKWIHFAQNGLQRHWLIQPINFYKYYCVYDIVSVFMCILELIFNGKHC